MRLRKSGFALMVLSAAAVLSCTKIDAPYATAKHGNIKDTVFNWDTVSLARRVMLEDYTGHKCVNCPEAAITARTLAEGYDGRLIVVAVHAGFYAIPGTGNYALDLRSPASEEWNTDFKFTSYPNGMVNRKDFGSGRVIPFGKWADDVAAVIGLEQEAQMLILNSYDSTSRNLSITVLSRFLEAVSGSYTLTVCILEDGIIGAQKNNNPNIGPTPDWYNYVFDDVMRGAVNGSKGELLTSEVNTSLTDLGRFQVTLGSSWVAPNCRVLAFISKSDSREIIQAETKPVIY